MHNAQHIRITNHSKFLILRLNVENIPRFADYDENTVSTVHTRPDNTTRTSRYLLLANMQIVSFIEVYR